MKAGEKTDLIEAMAGPGAETLVIECGFYTQPAELTQLMLFVVLDV